jgi:hypothetical protein
MYNTHQATYRHDKIYALLGMASDDVHGAGLSPDYSVPWETLQRRLFHFLLNENISVKTWPDREEVEIKGQGCVIGHVTKVTRGPNGFQKITVIFSEDREAVSNFSEKKDEWSLQVTSHDVCKGDIIYLLEGVSRSMIIRQFRAVFYIITLAAPSTG